MILKRFLILISAVFVLASYSFADVTHTIKKGDTLSKISRKHNVGVREIRELNGLKKSARLKTGHVLIVKRTGPRSYTVRKGDNIYRIAKKFDIDVDHLKDINLMDSDNIKAGQKLLLEPEPEAENKYAKNLVEEIRKISESEEVLALSMSDRVILFAKKFLNIPYKFGGNTIMGIDCSAYVQKVYGLIGINLPRSARLQFQEGEVVDRESLTIGDLVFFKTYASFPSHVGIYLGNDLFIHASSKDKKVSIDSLKTPYYLKRFIGGKRFIPNESEKAEKEPEEHPHSG